MTEINHNDYVELELLNQRLGELQQTMNYAKTQLDHSQVALEMLEALKTAHDGQDLLVPIGSGVFITVKADDVSSVKLSVGSGVVVDKEVPLAINYIQKQKDEIRAFSIKTEEIYNQTVEKTMALQKEIESKIQTK